MASSGLGGTLRQMWPVMRGAWDVTRGQGETAGWEWGKKGSGLQRRGQSGRNHTEERWVVGEEPQRQEPEPSRKRWGKGDVPVGSPQLDVFRGVNSAHRPGDRWSMVRMTLTGYTPNMLSIRAHRCTEREPRGQAGAQHFGHGGTRTHKHQDRQKPASPCYLRSKYGIRDSSLSLHSLQQSLVKGHLPWTETEQPTMVFKSLSNLIHSR